MPAVKAAGSFVLNGAEEYSNPLRFQHKTSLSHKSFDAQKINIDPGNVKGHG
jgi:hypothetical protein